MSSKPSKNNGSCLGYFIILALIYYVYDEYGAKILNFLKGSLRIIIIIALIWFVLFVLYKIIGAIYNYVSVQKNATSEDIPNVTVCNDIVLDSSDLTQTEKKSYIGNNSPDFNFSTNSSELLSDELDFRFENIADSVIEKGKASVGMIQRLYKIEFNRAEKILNQLEIAGIVGPEIGTKPRQVLMTYEEFHEALNNGSFANLHIPENLKTSVPTVSSSVTISDNERFKYYNDKFDYMSGYDFEEYCTHLLHEVGFLDVNITSASNDFGVDILAKYNGVLYAFQCKRYSSNVGIKAVQEISSGMKYYHANVGVVITNQYYTSQAQELASAAGIHLWDRDFLQKLIKASIEGTDLLSLMLSSEKSY